MWYPPVTPFRSGFLEVSGGHQLFWEVSGNPQGVPMVFLHGGPGGGCTANSRRWFDPRRYCIISFDQRGCGRSTPHASTEHNTTQHLIEDIEVLRRSLAVERWMLMGRSWGSALALAYAEAHPERVSAMLLSAVFTARVSELQWLYGGGAAQRAPEAWSRFLAPIAGAEDSCPIADYHARLRCGDPSAETAAARAWCEWEHALSWAALTPLVEDGASIRARALIGTHYFLHRAFLREGQLLVKADRLRGIRGVIVQGEDDAVTPPVTASELHRAWPGSILEIVQDAGHAATEPDMMRALVDASDRLVGHHRSGVALTGSSMRMCDRIGLLHTLVCANGLHRSWCACE